VKVGANAPRSLRSRDSKPLPFKFIMHQYRVPGQQQIFREVIVHGHLQTVLLCVPCQ